MKKILILLMLVTLGACRDDTSGAFANEQMHCVSRDVVNTLSRISGRVDRVAEMYVIRTSRQTYYACNLPDDYKRPGQSIRFDADVYRIPENVRLVGTPVLITKIY